MGQSLDAMLGFGERLKAARQKAGLTQLDVAKAAGTTHVQVSRVESGQKPTMDLAARLADAVGVHIAALLAPAKKGRKP